jgi:hypothetical protein
MQYLEETHLVPLGLFGPAGAEGRHVAGCGADD